MGAHLIDAFAVGVEVAAASPAVEAAVAAAGRRMLSRKTVAKATLAPWPQGNVLRWRVQQLRHDGPPILTVEEIGAERWDLNLFQALSAALPGAPVAAREHDGRLDRRGLALFLDGGAVQAVEAGPLDQTIHAGPASLNEIIGGRSVDEVRDARFAALCDAPAYRLLDAPWLAAEEWSLSPVARPFAPVPAAPPAAAALLARLQRAAD